MTVGESSSKLRSMLTAAQAANPPTKEVSKSKFSFRHPFAPPPAEVRVVNRTDAPSRVSWMHDVTPGTVSVGHVVRSFCQEVGSEMYEYPETLIFRCF